VAAAPAEVQPPTPSLESLPAHQEHSRGERRERRERQERPGDNPLLHGLSSEGGELTAMAEAFRAAARQRTSKEDGEGSGQ
jgi:small subunit ribosomal protein S1